MKIFTILIIGLLIFGVCVFLYNKIDKEDKMEEQKYQGPVPEGYDEQHFRETGETISIENG